MAIAIPIDNVGKTFGTQADPFTALLTVTDTIATGKFFTLIGPSGCGKTTLKRMIAGLIQPTIGHIEICGQKVINPVRRVSFDFQKPTLLASRTVQGNILLPIEIAGTSLPAAEAKVAELLALLNLARFANSFSAELNIFQSVGFSGFASWVSTVLIEQGITLTSSLLYTFVIAIAAAFRAPS